MKEEEFELVLGDLADLIWWIKGFTTGKDDCDTPFNSSHTGSLRKARMFLMKAQKHVFFESGMTFHSFFMRFCACKV